MTYQRILAVYFSPTGTTRKITCHIAKCLAEALGLPYREIDFTLPAARETPPVFAAGDLAVFATPVYAGRVPNILLPYLSGICGNGAAAVPVVVYGNRDYDDALIELCRLLRDAGLRAVAGAAFVGEHSFSDTLAAGRPDGADLQLAAEFAARVAALPYGASAPSVLLGSAPLRPYFQPLGEQGQALDLRKVKPQVADTCIDCGVCAAVCPTGAIDPAEIRRFVGICIKCGACVKRCPTGARHYEDADYLFHKADIERLFTRRAAPDLFIQV